MGRMVRKQVYLASGQHELLKRRARELDVPQSELIRRGIEQVGRSAQAESFDEKAWRQELAFIRRRARMRARGRGRQWTREELHDREAGRLSR